MRRTGHFITGGTMSRLRGLANSLPSPMVFVQAIAGIALIAIASWKMASASGDIWSWLKGLPWVWIGVTLVVLTIITSLVLKPTWRESGKKHWKPILTTVVVLIVALPVVGYAGWGLYKLYHWSETKEIMVAERQRATKDSTIVAEAAKAKAATELVAKLRDAPSFKSDTTLVIGAPASGTGYYVVGHGCRLGTGEVNPAHAYVVVNQLGRHEVVPGKDVYIGKTEYFRLEALGAQVTDVEITIFGCPKKGNPPMRRGA